MPQKTAPETTKDRLTPKEYTQTLFHAGIFPWLVCFMNYGVIFNKRVMHNKVVLKLYYTLAVAISFSPEFIVSVM